MPRGFSDYGVNTAAYGQYILDHAELAARLKSPTRYDRKGNVIYLSDFSNGVDDWENHLVADSKAGCYIDRGYISPGALRVTPPSYGASTSWLVKYLPIISAGIYGFETLFSFQWEAAKLATVVELSVSYFTGAAWVAFSVRVNPNNKVIQIYTDIGGSGVYKTILTIPDTMVLPLPNILYHYLKFTINVDTNLYGRLLFNNYGVDCSDTSPWIYPDTTTPCLAVSLVANVNAWYLPVDFSSIVATMNEPL